MLAVCFALLRFCGFPTDLVGLKHIFMYFKYSKSSAFKVGRLLATYNGHTANTDALFCEFQKRKKNKKSREADEQAPVKTNGRPDINIRLAVWLADVNVTPADSSVKVFSFSVFLLPQTANVPLAKAASPGLPHNPPSGRTG